MDERGGWRHLRMLVAAAAVLVVVPASAQTSDYGLREDSLGVAADAERLPVQRVPTECDPFGLRVVRDSVELRGIERFHGCDASQFPALGRDLYVHVQMGGDCHTRFGVRAYRSDSRREYRVLMVARPGGCRAGGFFSGWYRLPPLPEGWTVAFSRKRIDPNEE
jgi:hypothetical protein